MSNWSSVSWNLLNGFCSCTIGHRELCTSLDEGDLSTWEGVRDIGPPALAKNKELYKPFVTKSIELIGSSDDSLTLNPAVTIDIVDSSNNLPDHIYDRLKTPNILTRIKKSIKYLITGRLS